MDKKRTTKKKNLQSMALRVGATIISEDGKQFNAAKEKVPTKRVVTPKAKPTPPAKPEPSPEPAAKVITQQIAALRSQATVIAQQIAALRSQVLSINAAPTGDSAAVMSNLAGINERLGEILEAINNPREKTVEFKVVTDKFNFPTKVIASER